MNAGMTVGSLNDSMFDNEMSDQEIMERINRFHKTLRRRSRAETPIYVECAGVWRVADVLPVGAR